jgi:uncharacterized FlaG/YvyC family protein
MDSGLTVRPAAVTAQSPGVRLDAAPVRDAVRTDLAPAQSVTAAAKPTETRLDNSESADQSQVRKIVLDAHSREVIYQVLDAGSGRVVRQIPEEATLRLRAYVRALASGATTQQAQQADLEV